MPGTEAVRSYIDGVDPAHRPLFDRLHRLIITAHAASESARAAIEARGGRLTIVGAGAGENETAGGDRRNR